MKQSCILCSRGLFTVAMALFCHGIFALQTKKALDHADVHRWRKIEQQRLSNDGKWAFWSQVPVTEGDASLAPLE